MSLEDLSTKRVCVRDNGLFFAFARKLEPEFGHVYYNNPWQRAFSSVRQLAVGRGFGDVEKIKDIWDIEDKVDLWVFFDSFDAPLQRHLLKHGGRVWGARDAEELEHDRWAFQKWLERVGLPTLETERVTGMDELEAYLKDHKDVWVKSSYKWGGRADNDTWHHEDLELSSSRLRQLRYDLGPAGEEFGFVVQANLPKAVEIGYDGITVDGQWPAAAMQAYEIKGLGMIGAVKPYEQLAAPVRAVNAKLAPFLKEKQCRAGISTEIRWDGKRAYFIDPCFRLGSPSNELLQEMFSEWGRTFWEGAEGRMHSPKPVPGAQVGAVAMVYSEQSGNNWDAMKYPPAIDRWVKLRNPLRTTRASYAVPQGQPQNVAGVVGVGKTLLEAGAMMAEHARQVKGDRIQTSLESFEKALDVIEEGQRYGIRFTAGALPTAEQIRAAVAG